MNRVRVSSSLAVALVAIGAFAVVPPSASAAGGPVIPGGAWGGTGVTGPDGEPGAAFRYVTVHHGRGAGTTVEKISTDGGIVRQYRSFEGEWTLPAVTILGAASGLSADGETLVLIRPEYGLRADETSFRILDTRRLRTRERMTLDGRFSFDAVSPDGLLMYLVEYADPRDPLDYRIRVYDLARDEFRPGRVVDPAQPGERMSGQPVARQMSPDGRWAYTLYGGGEETFIHALDTEGATAVCVDLEQFEPRDLYRLGLEVDPGNGALTVLRRGDPAAFVDPLTFEVTEPEPAAAASPAPADDGGGRVPTWATTGAIVLALGALFGIVRRRRRSDGTDDLERLLEADPVREGDAVSTPRERDPVP